MYTARNGRMMGALIFKGNVWTQANEVAGAMLTPERSKYPQTAATMHPSKSARTTEHEFITGEP
jgi:hypothetical protein